ncbi:MAG: hypothetical protein IT427_10425 [Pirellulales bacterium]|nr:hypothetical protein [Pirellulales bacterium]
MKRIRTIGTLALLASVVTLFSASANAAFRVFTTSELLGMDIYSSSGYINVYGNPLTASPTYADGVKPMTGDAGATNILGVGGNIYYTLNAIDLAAFISSVSSGDILAELNTNDNNQTWKIGIWYDAGSGIVEDSVTLANNPLFPPGVSGATFLALPTPSSLVGVGVFVENIITQPDQYHASWSPPGGTAVPEASSMLVWSGLILVGALVSVRHRRKYVTT